MAKLLPYFKFFVSEWNDGDITIEDYKIQGLFINVCSYYWSKETELTTNTLYKRFKHSKEDIQYLISEGHLKDVDGSISISFLDEQLKERLQRKKANARGGIKAAANKKKKKEEAKEVVPLFKEVNGYDVEINPNQWVFDSWDKYYEKFTGKKTKTHMLSSTDKENLKYIMKELNQDKDLLRSAMVGLLAQEVGDVKFKDLKHLLKDEGVNIQKYIDAQLTGDKNLYVKKKKVE